MVSVAKNDEKISKRVGVRFLPGATPKPEKVKKVQISKKGGFSQNTCFLHFFKKRGVYVCKERQTDGEIYAKNGVLDPPPGRGDPPRTRRGVRGPHPSGGDPLFWGCPPGPPLGVQNEELLLLTNGYKRTFLCL